MKHEIILPSRPVIISEEGNTGIYEIRGLYPGYGVTIGNSLRRVMLSSLPGAAVTSVKIEGVSHEFSTLPGVLEDIIAILLNIKRLRFIVTSDEPQLLTLDAKGAKAYTAKNLAVPATVEIVDAESPILTITDKQAHIVLELTVEKGLGYVPRELARKEKVEVGMMTLDALFSPIRTVNYEVEDMRVGNRTDYNLLRFHIETDGTITPRDAFAQTVDIAVRQFTALAEGFSETPSEEETFLAPSEHASELEQEQIDQIDEANINKVRIEDLHLPSRTINALNEHGIKTIGGLLRRDTESLSEIPGIGEKAIQEIKRALGSMGLTLK